jgi:nucleoside-diphosphate-sugar epimerase
MPGLMQKEEIRKELTGGQDRNWHTAFRHKAGGRNAVKGSHTATVLKRCCENQLVIVIAGGNGRLAKYIRALIPEARTLGSKECDIVTDYSASDLRGKLKGASAIINTVGRVFGTYTEIRKANVEVTDALLSAMPPECAFVQISSIAVYGKGLAKKPADEETPLRPDSAYAKTKAEAEQLVMEKAERHAILRPGPIYGARYHDYLRMMDMCAGGKAAIIGKGNNVIPFTNAWDVANAVKSAIEMDANGTFVIVSRRITQREAMETMSGALGTRQPKPISYGLAWLYAAYCEWLGKCFMNFERFGIMASDRPFSTKKAERDLGFKPSDTREGIRQMAIYYKSGGKYGKDI